MNRPPGSTAAGSTAATDHGEATGPVGVGAATAAVPTLGELASAVGGEVVGGDPALVLTGIAALREAGPGQLTFLAHPRYLPLLQQSRASAVLAGTDAAELPLPSIRVKSPYLAFAHILRRFHPAPVRPVGIHPTAFVDERATVDPTASIGPLCVVEAGARVGAGTRLDAQVVLGPAAGVGADCHLHSHVVIEAGCRLGDRVIVHGGTVIGSDGFGFTPDPAKGGAHAKIPQVGIVEIADDVEIGANVAIDRAAMGCTSVGRGTKIDNLVHLAHNVQIGEHCLLVAQVGISGSTTLGNRVTLAGQSGLVGHISVGDGATVAARGVPTHDVEAGAVVSGFPARPHQEERRIMAALGKLPELVKTVAAIKRFLKLGD